MVLNFVNLFGFAVPNSEDIVKPICFGGMPSLNTDVAASRKSGKEDTNTEQKPTHDMVQDLISIQIMDRGDVMAWANGGIVLITSLVILMRTPYEVALGWNV